LAALLLAAASAAAAPAPLRTVAAIRRLLPAAAARHLPARITGVVTYFGRITGREGAPPALYVQDATGGIYVDLQTLHPPLRAGDRVRVIGHTGAGDVAPILVARQVRLLGVGRLPAARAENLRQAETGLDDAQRIQVRGVIQAQRFTPKGLRLTLKENLARLVARLPITPADHPPEWVDAGVRVTGVLAHVMTPSHPARVELFVPSIAAVQVVQPPPAHPFHLPRQRISALLRYTAWGVFPHRVRVQGVVTAVGESGFALQDATGGAWLQWAAGRVPAERLRLGERVTAVGFPTVSDSGVVLDDVRVQALGLGPPPRPGRLPRTAAAAQRVNGRLEFAVARLRQVVITPPTGPTQEIRLYLSRGGAPLQAVLYGSEAARLASRHLPPGSVLRLTGIAVPLPGAGGGLPGAAMAWRLWLRGSSDVVVLRAPSWWTAERLHGLFFGLLLVALLALLWNLVLRRSLRQQAATILRQTGERAELERQLQHAQRMEALGRLAGGIAHDFNNLLTVVSGRTAMLLATGCSDRERAGLEAIQGAADRAAALTRQLLAYSRRQTFSPAPLDLNAMLAEFLPMLRALVGDSIELVTDLAPQLPLIFADRGPLEQAVMNLVINARDAMPNGGPLRLATALAPPTDSPAGKHHGPRVRLQVTDSGAGMSEEVQQRIFEPFFTTKEPGRGTGLGLALVYGIVEQSGGEISVRSALGQGSTFTIFLPLAGSGVPLAAAATPNA
jgi:signal transduction histidine kinase